MALGFESGFGAIAAAAGLDKVEMIRHWRDEQVKAQTDALTNSLKEYRDKDLITQAEFEKALAAIRPKAEAMANDDVKRLTSQLDRAAQVDPMGTYERIREGNLGSLATLAGQVKGFATAQDRLALQRFAGGNRGDGTGGLYGQVARQAQVNRDVLPLANTIYANLGRDTNVIGGETSRGLADYVNLLRERSAIPFRNAYTSLLPQQARYNALGQQIGALGGLNQISKDNLLGVEAKENKWGRFLKGFGRSLDELGGTAVDLYTSYLGGGMGGSKASQNTPSANAPFQGSPYYGSPPSSGGYNPGSGGYETEPPAWGQPRYPGVQETQPRPPTSGNRPETEPQGILSSGSIPYDAYFTGYA